MITRKQCEELIERLSGRVYSETESMDWAEWLESQVRIGDVLDTGEVTIAWTEEQRAERIIEIWELWHECGTTKSLQELLDEAPWKKVPAKKECGEGETNYFVEHLGDSNTDRLFSYLIELGL